MSEVLLQIGFSKEGARYTGSRGGFKFESEGIELYAFQGLSRYFKEKMIFSGFQRTSRSITEISFETPLLVESYEQGVAWVSEALRMAGIPSIPGCLWYEVGGKHRNLLPRVRRRAEYRARPRCWVAREWMRVALKKLREHTKETGGSHEVCFRFDGEILRIESEGLKLLMSAEGEAWNESFTIAAQSVSALPKKLMKQQVEISVLGDLLCIGRQCVAVIDQTV